MSRRKKNAEYGEGTSIFQYVKQHKKELPTYWHDKGVYVCVDGICAMLARGKHSDYAIADFYECPVEMIEMIRETREKTLRRLEREHAEMVERFGELYTGIEKSANDDFGFIEILRIVFGR